MAKRALTEAQKNRIWQLSEEDGFSQSKIAPLYDVSQSTIHNVLKEKRHEAEIAELKNQMQNAMARGVQAAIEDGSVSPTNSPLYSSFLLSTNISFTMPMVSRSRSRMEIPSCTHRRRNRGVVISRSVA